MSSHHLKKWYNAIIHDMPFQPKKRDDFCNENQRFSAFQSTILSKKKILSAYIFHFVFVVVFLNFHCNFEFTKLTYCDLAQFQPRFKFYFSFLQTVIFLDFHSTKQGMPLVDYWSRGLDQNQMYPNRDTLSNVPHSGYITAGDQSMVESGVTEGGKNSASFLFHE